MVRSSPLVLTALVWSLSCGALVGDYAVAPEPTCGEHGPPDPVCASCTANACAAEVAACLADEACAPLHRCLVSCAADDSACRAACMSACPIPNETASALTACRRAGCRDACVPCGGIFDFFGEPECGGCIADSCCKQTNLCLDDPLCAEFVTCFEACGVEGGTICVLACQGEAVEAERLHSFFRACIETCRGACSAQDGFWDCAGRFEVPLPQQDTIVDRNQYLDFLSEAPVPGVTVKACRASDVDCSDPIATEVSDADGVTGHQLPGGFLGFYEVNAEGYYPTIYLFALPLLFDRDPRQTPLISLAVIPPFEALLDTTLQPGRTHFVFVVEDCVRQQAAGITVTAEPSDGSTTFYLEDGIPSPDATSTVDKALGGILNLPAVTLRVRGVIEATGEQVFEHVVQTRPDTVVQMQLTPSPR